jgi:hypothetical protein
MPPLPAVPPVPEVGLASSLQPTASIKLKLNPTLKTT